MFGELSQAVVAVLRTRLKGRAQGGAAHGNARLGLPRHAQGRDVPSRAARDPACRVVARLMAGHAQCTWRTLAIVPAHNTELVPMPVVPLPGIVGGGVAV